MQNYDEYKLANPFSDEDLTKECAMCDAPILEERTYCSDKCFYADN